MLGRGISSIRDRYDKCYGEICQVLRRGIRVRERYNKCRGEVCEVLGRGITSVRERCDKS